MTRIGVIFSPYSHPPEALRDAAVAADESGVAELWLWEDCFRSSAFAAAAAALAVTDRLRVGIGIAPMPLRNAAATAMEIATIERMSPGRLLPGLGHGVLPWMAQVGARVASPLTLMREYVPAVRALLAGEVVSVAGRYVTLDRVRLDWPPAVAPRVYASAEGPKTLVLSGEVADGTVLNSGQTLAEVARSVEIVRAGRSAADRSETTHDVVAYARAVFGRDAEARAISMAGATPPPDATDRALHGDVEQVAAGVRRFAAAGVDDVVLLPPPDEPDLTAYVAHAAALRALV